MAKVHGIVYIAVGIFVSIMSWKLNYEKLIFFFYAGLIFVFVGIVKLAFSLVKNKTSKKENLHHRMQGNIKYCHNCGTALRLHHKFCVKCSARV